MAEVALDETRRPFDELRVLDLSDDIAGGYAGKLLVDGGADLVLVETVEGDPLRRWTAAAQPLDPGEDGVLFRFLRASTRSVVADATDPATIERILELAQGADVVLQGFVPGAGHRFGVDPARMMAANPALVVVSISPWGTSGPWANRPATEFTVQAACGATARRGLPDRPPVSAGGRLGEWLVGVFAAVGALTGWFHARRSGAGQHVDVSMLEAVTLCLNGPYQAIAAQWYPDLRPGRTIEVPSIEPAADGQVGFSTQTGQQWTDFCVMIGRPDLAEDRTLRSADARMRRMEEIEEAIAAAIGTQTVGEIVDLAAALRIPVTPVGTGSTVTSFDQMVARGTYARGPDSLRRPRPPYRLAGAGPVVFGPAPRLGQHGAPSAGDLWPTRDKPDSGPPEPGRPFSGLRVVDLSAFWAGPFATSYLAAMGADVLKIESVTHPDGIRFLGGFRGSAYWERSMVYHGANPGKRDLTLDLDSDDGRALLWRLIEKADVVIENFTPRVLERFGVTWDDLHDRWPEVVLVRMPAFGLDGPWRERAGFAMTIEQTSGLAWVTGYEDRPLVPRGPCDPLGGMHAIVALCAALECRRRTGRGVLVEVPLVDGALNVAAEQVLEYDRTGEVLTRHQNRSSYAAPQGLYPSAGDDRWLALAVTTDTQWQAVVGVIDLGPLAADASLSSAAGRRAAHEGIDAAIAVWSRTREAEEAATKLCALGVPAAEVAPAYLAHLNPQLAHRRFLQPLDHPVTGRTSYPAFPMQFSALGPDLFRSAPPLLGEHNTEILASLGLTSEQIDELVTRRVIGDRPAWVEEQ